MLSRFISEIRSRNREPDLTVLAYHRVGRRDDSAFDPWVITADQEQLAKQLRFFKKHHQLVGLEDALAIASGSKTAPGKAILITFDDGYLDNYQAALPVLRAVGVSATFFVVADFMTKGTLAWWDRLAWQIRAAGPVQLCLPVADGTRRIDLRGKSPAAAIDAVLALYKTCPAELLEEFEASVRAAVSDGAMPPPERLFMNAEEARRLVAQGMAIGAHSCTHPILARLSPAAQFDEMHRSRLVLEAEIGAPVEVMAYPVGGPADFDATTQSLAAQCRYRAAFSCHGGINRPGRIDPFDIKRTAVYWRARPRQLLAG